MNKKYHYTKKELRRMKRKYEPRVSVWEWLFTNLWGEKVSTLALVGNVAFVLVLAYIMFRG